MLSDLRILPQRVGFTLIHLLSLDFLPLLLSEISPLLWIGVVHQLEYWSKIVSACTVLVVGSLSKMTFRQSATRVDGSEYEIKSNPIKQKQKLKYFLVRSRIKMGYGRKEKNSIKNFYSTAHSYSMILLIFFCLLFFLFFFCVLPSFPSAGKSSWKITSKFGKEMESGLRLWTYGVVLHANIYIATTS